MTRVTPHDKDIIEDTNPWGVEHEFVIAQPGRNYGGKHYHHSATDGYFLRDEVEYRIVGKYWPNAYDVAEQLYRDLALIRISVDPLDREDVVRRNRNKGCAIATARRADCIPR
jgi:hypothetical protein